MSPETPAGHETAAPDPVSAVAELVARHRPDSRRIRQLIALLTGEPMNLAALVQLSALPRRTVESVLSALDGDLSRSGDQVCIAPGQIDAYRQRFGYGQLLRTEPADPLAARLAEAAAIVKTMTELIAEAPPARTDLDHVPATPETAVRRALWLDSTYDLAGAVLLFVGDHDLTSLAVAQVSPDAELIVVDIDEATLEFIDAQASRLGHLGPPGAGIRCLAGDLRFGLPERAAGSADLVFTDPPYTPEGVELFVARGLKGLANRDNGAVIMAYGHSDLHPALGFAAQSAAHRLGLVYEAVLPRFNRYAGAQAVGSSSALYVWRPTPRTWRALDQLPAEAAPGIYTQGTQAVEAQPAAIDVPGAVLKVTEEAGYPIALIAGGPADASRKTARLRLGTLFSAGIPAAVTTEGRSVLADLSGGPDSWLLRALLAANASRVVLLVPNSHPDLATQQAQQSLAALLRPKYALRFLRSQPDPRHAIVVADAVDRTGLDEKARIAHRILSRVHGKAGNSWREALIETARERGTDPLSKRDARAQAEARARQPHILDTRLIDLPRHQIARLLDDAAG